jgi:hypothetical protein
LIWSNWLKRSVRWRLAQRSIRSCQLPFFPFASAEHAIEKVYAHCYREKSGRSSGFFTILTRQQVEAEMTDGVAATIAIRAVPLA